MTKQKISLLIPLIITAVLLTYCWIVILSTDILATWRHYLGLGLFLVLVLLYFKNYKWAIIGAGIYFLLATFNMLSMTAEINTSWLKMGSFSTPPIQLLSLVLLVLFSILNFNQFIDMYLDYKEAKNAK